MLKQVSMFYTYIYVSVSVKVTFNIGLITGVWRIFWSVKMSSICAPKRGGALAVKTT